ncbi:MAG: acetyl-CoA carboxylase biotin carboxyl carrier protein subunit [Bdellovibrionaceae bacterium]|nr:acetyl-CoA carboxylase biotin carboxyl carrier protein subunit [Pseudobdellovibrionaceae bacterium]
MQKMDKKIGGEMYKVVAQCVDDKIWIHMNGETIVLDAEVSTGRRRGKSSGKDAKSNVILAPMPGKITKLFKKQGELVVIGESVLVMEAMKMEYTLKANINGTIKKVAFKEGDQVVLGAQIVDIEPAKEV